MTTPTFTEEQKQYLQGFAAGVDVARQTRQLPPLSPSLLALPVLGNGHGGGANGTVITIGGSQEAGPAGPERIHYEAQNRFIAAGKKLTNEENAKRNKNPFDMWDEMAARAQKDEFPKGTDLFLTKYHGLFHVAPAQNSYMCRLRFAGGIISSHQMRGLAELADRYAGPYAHVTTRANLQLREIAAKDAMDIMTGLTDLGIINRGSGADNIRNVTASPTAGIDPSELIDTRDLARQMHHYILNHREMYGLPRKFNIAFDGGGTISAVADTNDIGFFAVRVGDHLKGEAAQATVEPGVYFRMELGGITGHKDFSRDTGVLLRPDQCVAVAAAVVRVFIDHGDRTDRKKARLKYLLDAWGFEKFLEETQKHLSFELLRFPLERCEPRPVADPLAHVDVHPQKQQGLHYIGITLPVGKLTTDQMRGLSRIAECFGSGDMRLTVWQNLIITNIPSKEIAAAQQAIEALGLHWSATNIRAGLVACTGNKGCKFAASDTKGHALAIADYLEARITLDQPINIHLTGCHHSCAQHYIGDIGLIGASVSEGDDMVEGYHLFVGGGFGEARQIGRELYRNIKASQVPVVIEKLLRGYLMHRATDDERFRDYANRLTTDELIAHADEGVAAEAA